MTTELPSEIDTATIITWRDDLGVLYWIAVDATTGGTHAFNNTVTDHPVEVGANLTDHVRPDPARLQITGMVTNTPHYLPRDHVGGASLDVGSAEVNIAGSVRVLPIVAATAVLQGPALQPPGAVVSRVDQGYSASARYRTFDLSFDRVREVFDELVRLRDTGTLCRVLTRLHEYDDLVIEVLTFPEDPNIGEALVFDIGFKQVRTVETRTVKVPKHKGTVSKKVVTPAEVQEADNTVVGVLADKIGAFFGN